jgi:hypothetical protein
MSGLGKHSSGTQLGTGWTLSNPCLFEPCRSDPKSSMAIQASLPSRHSTIKATLIGIGAALAVLVTAFVVWQRVGPRAVTLTTGQFPEELVYFRSSDEVMNAGAMFTASKTSSKRLAVIWMHGSGANFYSPTYVTIGRALAARGYTTISGNTRMHDLGNVTWYRHGKRLRGGGYRGVASEEVRDPAAWIDFAAAQGFSRIVLVEHSHRQPDY